MDIVAHALWTNALYKKVLPKKRCWRDIMQIIFWSNFPDFFSFGIVFLLNIFRLEPIWRDEGYYIRHLPEWFYLVHGVVYSIPIFLAVFALAWLMARKPYILMGGWLIHIAIDIFTHKTFFAPRFLWPFSDFHLEVISWANSRFMLINYSALAIVYLSWYFLTQKKKAPAS